jgi:hypothetical protein
MRKRTNFSEWWWFFARLILWLHFWMLLTATLVLAYRGIPATWADIASMASIGLWAVVYRWINDW